VSRADYVTALTAGRNANVGDVNPYTGRGILADLWRTGYESMLEAWLADAQSRQRTLRDQ